MCVLFVSYQKILSQVFVRSEKLRIVVKTCEVKCAAGFRMELIGLMHTIFSFVVLIRVYWLIEEHINDLHG